MAHVAIPPNSPAYLSQVQSIDPDPTQSPDGSAPPPVRGKVLQEELQNIKNKFADGTKVLPVAQGGTAVPTITIQDIDQEKQDQLKQKTPTPESGPESPSETPNSPVGDFPDVPAPSIPDWYRVGWRQVSGIDDIPSSDPDEKDRSVLDLFISEQYYGTWFHNAGIIIFAVVTTHFLTLFRLGWGWIFIILAICCTYYTTSMRRARRVARDEIQRELVKTKLDSEKEPVEWLNAFLERFWLIYEPVLSKSILASIEPILLASTPTFLDSLRMPTFTLGAKAPRIQSVKPYPRTEEDTVQMDMDISFAPVNDDDADRQDTIVRKGSKIVLMVRLGRGLATAGLPIFVKDISFEGLMRIRMKLTSTYPHIQTIDISFLGEPRIDFVLKPVGGETFGFDIANLPGLSNFIRDMLNQTLAPMMYAPNVYTLNLEQMLSGKPLDSAIGVIQVTVHSARGIKGAKIGGGTPDPYVGLSFGNRGELSRTKYKLNTYNPTWVETMFLLVNSLNETLNFNLMDHNDHRKDTLLGTAMFDMQRLMDDASQEGITTPIYKDGKDRGELRADVIFYPVLEPQEIGDSLLETNVGVVRITVHQAKELDASKNVSGDVNPFVKLYVGNPKKPSFTTLRHKHNNNPVWEAPYEFLCSDKKNTIITVKIIDDRDFLKDPVIGYMSIKLTDLLGAMNDPRQDWFNLTGCKSGKIRLSSMWKPLNIAGGIQGTDQYKPPIGVVRVLLDKATDVKNVELSGKSDPYIRVQVNNMTKGRTEVVNNNLNPVWDQIVYIPVHSLKENLIFECMDYQHLTKDRSLGTVELLVSELAETSGEEKYPYKPKGIKDANDPLRLEGNAYKGYLHYMASFIPALALDGVKFSSPHKDRLQHEHEEHHDEEGGYVDGGGISSDDENHTTPAGVTIRLNRDSTISQKRRTGSNDVVDAAKEGDESRSPSPTKDSEKKAGINLTVDELLACQSGIIVFDIISGRLSKKARLEVLMDDGYWPCFSTIKARSVHAEWQFVGEGFVKEIDFSQVWFRLNDAPEGDKDNIISQWKGDTKTFLKSALNGPTTYTLTDVEGGNKSIITVEARYVPVPVQLEARESVNNQGNLRVDLIDGQEIRGVDRGGKSDPFVVFTLNGQKVYKSQTKKKTLAPEWNENFTFSVPSRVAAIFTAEVFDWNQIEQAKSLGIGTIDVANLEPFESTERYVQLSTTKHGQKGQIRIRLMFQPEIIAKTRKNTSTFTTAGRAMTQIGALPVTAGKGVFHGVTGVFKKKKTHDNSDSDDTDGSLVEVPAGIPDSGSKPAPLVQADVFSAPPQAAAAAPGVSFGSNLVPVPNAPPVLPVSTAFPTSGSDTALNSGTESGTLRVTVIDAQNLPEGYKPYAILRLGDKEVKTKHTGKTSSPIWNETFTFHASPLTPKLFLWIHDHKTLGKDKLLGEGDVDIWRHISSIGTSQADIPLRINGGNSLVRLRLEFDANLHPSGSGSSVNSGEPRQTRISFTSPSRISIRGKRSGEADD